MRFLGLEIRIPRARRAVPTSPGAVDLRAVQDAAKAHKLQLESGLLTSIVSDPRVDPLDALAALRSTKGPMPRPANRETVSSPLEELGMQLVKERISAAPADPLASMKALLGMREMLRDLDGGGGRRDGVAGFIESLADSELGASLGQGLLAQIFRRMPPMDGAAGVAVEAPPGPTPIGPRAAAAALPAPDDTDDDLEDELNPTLAGTMLRFMNPQQGAGALREMAEGSQVAAYVIGIAERMDYGQVVGLAQATLDRADLAPPEVAKWLPLLKGLLLRDGGEWLRQCHAELGGLSAAASA